MSAALIQKLRYMARQYTSGQFARGGNPPSKHYLDEAADLLEQYHREASAARCPDCGETTPAEIHTCSPKKTAGVEPVAYEYRLRIRNQGDEWSEWHRCSSAALKDFARSNDKQWEYETRELFTTPPDAEALRKRVAELEAEVERLAGLLSDAADDIQGWASYATEYFQQKHGLAGCVAKYRNAALVARKEG